LEEQGFSLGLLGS